MTKETLQERMTTLSRYFARDNGKQNLVFSSIQGEKREQKLLQKH